MNKVYRVIWNASLGTWVAVSEIAKGKTKNSVSIGQTVLVDNSYTAQLDKEFSYKKLLLAIFTVFTANFAHSGYEAGTGSTRTNCTQTSVGSGGEATGAIAIGSDNSTACAPEINSVAIGQSSWAKGLSALAIGPDAKARADYGIAMGNNAQALSQGSMAFGSGAYANSNSTADGTGAVAFGNDAVALGKNSFALGAAATVTDDNTVSFGYTKGDVAYFNGTPRTGTNLSQGYQNGKWINDRFMRLANVANGYKQENDAVNVSQIRPLAQALGTNVSAIDGTVSAPNYIITKTDGTTYAAVQTVPAALKNLNDEVVKPLGFVGDSGTKATRKLGEDLNVKGGATGTLTNGNIGVVSNGSNQLDIKLAETVNLGTNGSVTTGNTKIDNSGLTITGGPSVTSTGINAGSKVITNVAAGSAATDAVNKGQLDSSLANANSNAAVVYTNAAGDKVTKAADGKWYAATDVNADGSLIGSPSEVAAANIITSVQNANGSTTTATKLGNVAAGSVTASSTDAVNGSQLYAVSEVANAGWNIATDSGTASNVKPGDTVNMKGDGSVVVSNTGNDVTVGLADVVTVGKGDSAVTIDGTKGTIQAGTEVTIDGNTGVIQAGDVTINGDKGTVNGLSNTTWNANNIVKGQAATEDQLKAVADNVTTAVGAAKTEVEAGKNVTVSSKLGDKGQTIYTVATKDEVDFNKVTVGGLTINNGGIDMGDTKITNLTAGDVNSTSTDAVNGSQLYAVSEVANAGWNIATDSGTASNVKPGDTVNMKGDGSVVVSNTGNDVTVGLADVVTVGKGDSAVTIDGTKGTIQAGTEVTIDGNTGVIQAGDVTINGDKGTVNGLSNTTWNANNIVKGQAATEDQLKAVADNVTTAVGAAKTEVEAGKNVTVYSKLGDKGQTIYTVATKDEVDFNKVTVGGLTINNGGIDMGDTKITNLTAGDVNSTSTDAVNGSQLYAVSEVANKGHNVTTAATGTGTVTGNGVTNVAPGDTVTYTAGNNIAVTQNGKEIQIATSMTPTFTTVNTTNLNTTGVTNLGGTTNITGDAYYTGSITNGDHITNKTYVDKSITTLANNPLTFAGDTGTDVARKLGETLNIVGGNTGTLTDGNIGIEGNGTDTLTVKLASDLSGLNSVSITNGPTINTSGIDMNNTKITELTAGDVNSTSTDAVNGSQLYAVSEVANKGHNVTTAATGTGTVTGTAVTNVAPGDTVTYTAGNNIAVTQVGKDIQIATSMTPTFTTVNTTNLTVTGETKLEGDTYLSGDTYYTGPITKGDNIVNKTYVDNSITTLANNPLTFAGDTGTDVARKLGETLNIVGGNTGTLTDGNIGIEGNGTDTLTVKLASDLSGLNSVSITNGPTINTSGIDMNNTKITELTAGDVNSTSTDAVNGSQLYAVSEVANKGHNVTTAATGTGTVTGTAVTNVAPGDTVTYTAGNNIEVTQNGKEIQIATSLTPTFTTVNTTNLTVTGETKLEGDTYLSGDTYYTGPITNGNNIVNKTYVDNSITTLANNPLTFAGDTGTDVARKLGETLNIVGGNTGTLTDGNIGVVADGSDTLTVKLASDLAGLNSVSIVGGPTINNGGIDMGGDKITNLTAGDVNSTSTDAVNGSQLYAVSEVANKGHNVTTAATGTGTVTGTAVTNVAPGDTVTYTAGNNIEVTQNGKEIQIATSLTPTFTTVNTTNLTVTGETKLEGDTYLSGDTYYTGPITNGNNIVNKTYVDNSITTLANNPLTFAGDTGTDVARKLGETLNIVGGNTGTLTDGNIGIEGNGTDTLTVKLASDLSGLNSITINGGPVINNAGINMNGGTITNLAAGVADTDAVNVSQLKEVSNVANAGWNIATDSGTASNVKPGDTVNMKGDGSVVVSNTGNNVTIGLSDKVKVGDKVSIDGTTGEINAGQIKIDGNKGTINNLNNTTWNGPNNIVSGQAATEDQLAQVVNNVNNQTTAAKTEVTQGDNIVVTASKAADGHSIYNVSTAKDVKFDSVTSNVVQVGNVKIDKDGINAGGQKVTNVAAGKVSTTSTDAVNGSQLYGYAEGVKNIIGGTTTYNPETGKYTNSDIGGTGKDNINDAIGAVNNSVINLGDRIDNAFYQTYKRIDKVEKEANAGIASAMAMETAPFIAGKWTYAVGAAYHGGEQAVGATLRKTADNGRWSLTGGVATGTEGDPSVRIGISGVID